jgi:hypothetical protein
MVTALIFLVATFISGFLSEERIKPLKEADLRRESSY